MASIPEPTNMDLYVNSQLIHKGHSSYPKPQRKPGELSPLKSSAETYFLDEYEQVSSQLSDKQIAEMKIINRGHLGVPEEILKAGANQYASMCGNINNKVKQFIFDIGFILFPSLCCANKKLMAIHVLV